MGWFSKKEDTKEEAAPTLPELPRLPELPKLKNMEEEPLSQLPSFPNNSLGEKFSQNTIKEAVSGRKEDDEVEADDFADDEMQMMPEPQENFPMRKPSYREINSKKFPEFNPIKKNKSNEPIFVRIDKFEESSELLEKIKMQITDIEKILSDTKRIKEEEEEELEMWQNELETMKNQIEKIDKNMFSELG